MAFQVVCVCTRSSGTALAAPRPRETTALRRRLLRLSVRLRWHPCWQTVPSVPAARSQLRQLGRVHGAVPA
nr:hypothetical protein [Streptomyces albus]